MPGAAATAAAASGVQSRLSMFERRPPAGVAASATSRRFGSGGSGGGGGSGGSRSWYFGTDISDAPEGAIAVRLTPHADAAASSVSASVERRAQATVWDHVRSERRSVGADPALEAEAKRLMAAAASAAGREKKRLCFARDSIIAETFEYQSEQSLMAELKITPDYPVEPFEPPVAVATAAAHRKSEAPRTAPDYSRSTAVPAASASAAPAAAPAAPAPAAAPAAPAPAAAASPAPAPAADIGSYKAKLATDVFVWGARGSQPANATAAMNGGVGNEQQQQQQQQQQQERQQWSVSTTADLLF